MAGTQTIMYPQKTLAKMDLGELLTVLSITEKGKQIHRLTLIILERDFDLTEEQIKDQYPEYFL